LAEVVSVDGRRLWVSPGIIGAHVLEVYVGMVMAETAVGIVAVAKQGVESLHDVTDVVLADKSGEEGSETLGVLAVKTA